MAAGRTTAVPRDVIASRHAGLLEWLVATPAVDIVDHAWRDRRRPDRREPARGRRPAGDRADGVDPVRGARRRAIRSASAVCRARCLRARRSKRRSRPSTRTPSLRSRSSFAPGAPATSSISASPGFDLRERFEWPEHFSSHGGLIRDHMLVPFASSVPLEEGPVRTADIAATVLDYLGVPAPSGVDGATRLTP